VSEEVSSALHALGITEPFAVQRMCIPAATAGDDYELLFTAPPGFEAEAPVPITWIGRAKRGSGLAIEHGTEPTELSGYEH